MKKITIINADADNTEYTIIILLCLLIILYFFINNIKKHGLSGFIYMTLGLLLLLYLFNSHPLTKPYLYSIINTLNHIKSNILEPFNTTTQFSNIDIESHTGDKSLAHIKSHIQRKVPATGSLYRLQSELFKLIDTLYNKNPKLTYFNINNKLNYYFNKSYVEIYNILGGDTNTEILPQHTMINLYSTQQRVYKTIHNTVFISNTSDIHPSISTLLQKIIATYDKVNHQLASIVNNKKNKQITIYSGYLNYPNEPKPYDYMLWD